MKLLLVLLAAESVASAQSACTPEYLMTIRTPWVYAKKMAKDGISVRQQQLIALIQQAYPQPAGLEARAAAWPRISDDLEYGADPARRYAVSTSYFHYWCFNGKPTLSVETGTWIECYVNSLTGFMEAAGLELPGGKPVYFMPYQVGTLKGQPLYSIRKGGGDRHREALLLAPPGKFPLRPVSREEFVGILHEVVKNEVSQFHQYNRQLEESLQETLRQADKLSFQTPAEREKYKEDARESIRSGFRSREKTVRTYEASLRKIDSLLHRMPAEERHEQAVVDNPTGMLLQSRGQSTFEEQARNGRPLVTYDERQISRSLPPEAIRFLQVRLRYEDSADMIAKRRMIREWTAHIDVAGLQEMVGK